jgi:uncharacterized membrane protein
MKKRYLVIFLLLIPLVLADEITINFNSPDKEDFTNYFLTLKIDGLIEKEILTSSSLKIDLPVGEHQTEAILDDFSTPVPDYFGAKTIGNKDTDYFVFPIGFVQGSVVDSQGNLIPKADLTFNCFSPIEIELPTQADSTGFFTIPNIPVGSCTVIAATKEIAGSTEFTIKQGQAMKVEIILAKEVIGDDNKTEYLILAVFFLALLLWIFLKKTKKERIKPIKEQKQEEAVNLKEEQQPSLPKQTKALMETLSSKEKKIIEFLLENNHHSSQSKIRHGTKTPRTSLSRILHKLEQKKLVQTIKEGKMVSVALTKFFLDK